MAIVKRGSKSHVLDYLARARKATIEEQDHYCEIIARSQKPDANQGMNQKVLAGGWKAVKKVMQDCCCPPGYDERKRFLKISWEQEPSRVKLDTINDKDVRYMTYFLNSTIEHTQRLRAMAMFVERVGTLKERGGTFYQLWSQIASLRIMHKEAIQMEKDNEAELILELITAYDKAADILFTAEWDQEEINRLLPLLRKRAPSDRGTEAQL